MPQITFVAGDGTKKEVDAPNGLSVLEVAHKNDIDLEGACEGSLACSTCHVVVNKEWFERLDEASEDAHPDVDVVNLRFTDLWKWVQELPGFDDDPEKSSEKTLEAIQMAWLDERD